MDLNNLKPAAGSKKARRRVGRGMGSGLGKTAGRGHKGQKSRAGGYHKVGFEGGQMPLQRRLPKRGFKSRSKQFNAEVTLAALERLGAAEVDLLTLKQAGLIGDLIKSVKVIKTGELTKAVALKGIAATAGAKAAIEAAGGSVADMPFADVCRLTTDKDLSGDIGQPTREERQIRRPAAQARLPAARAGGLSRRRPHSGAGHQPG